MKILGMDYQTFWMAAGAVWAVLKITGLIIEAEKTSTLRGIHDELKAVNGFLKRIERITNARFPDDDLFDERVK